MMDENTAERPAPPPASKDALWIGIDVGGTKTLCLLLDAKYKQLAKERKKTKGFQGAKAGVDRIVQMVEATLEEISADAGQLAGIGIGCPGPVDMDRGVLIDAPNLGWEDLRLAKLLQARLGCPVELLNDVDAGIYGEYRFGAARGSKGALGVFPGTGVGGGFVRRGEILSGAASSCLEIGHIQVQRGGSRCGCGNIGCLETVASRLAIAAECAQAAYRGQAPHLRKLAGTDLSNIRSGQLAAAIKEGDEVVRTIVLRSALHLGVAVSWIVNLLSPDTVVLGGGLVEAMPELIVPHVEEIARERSLSNYRDSFKVSAATLGDNAAVLGAAAWARRKIEGSE